MFTAIEMQCWRMICFATVAAMFMALPMVVSLSAASGSHAFPSLIGMQIVLVPVLRQIARARWNQIDWLLLRQPLAAARIA